MKIFYELFAKDMAAFTAYALRHSPGFRRRMWLLRVIVPVCWSAIMYLAASVFFGRYERNYFILPGLGLVAFIWFFTYPSVYLDMRRRQVKKLYESESEQRRLGEHELCLDEEGIFVSAPLGETRLKWSAIEEIAETEHYIFFCISRVAAIILPKEEMADDALCEHLVKLARRYHAAARGKPESSN
jgi:hypothetical protein